MFSVRTGHLSFGKELSIKLHVLSMHYWKHSGQSDKMRVNCYFLLLPRVFDCFTAKSQKTQSHCNSFCKCLQFGIVRFLARLFSEKTRGVAIGVVALCKNFDIL